MKDRYQESLDNAKKNMLKGKVVYDLSAESINFAGQPKGYILPKNTWNGSGVAPKNSVKKTLESKHPKSSEPSIQSLYFRDIVIGCHHPKESEVSLILSHLINGITEAGSIYGRIDIINNDLNLLIEVKHRTDWKSAIGQALAYTADPKFFNHRPCICLFGGNTMPNNQIINVFHRLGIWFIFMCDSDKSGLQITGDDSIVKEIHRLSGGDFTPGRRTIKTKDRYIPGRMPSNRYAVPSSPM